ncbi:MAG: TetR/AcrR family transcriptional regulator [Alphaproteobacteria bacterium]|jgi:AcrR family transcriptional regulator|nr:TetR/AcrR family transcriptional regulator [Rhodospirillaceae bacterium]MDG2481944.1 TetR/AcrR family transcriptional regulator [Alphaproteobacteria bacterium]MBT6203762.1 TetR/AcrR family transcriptional regulator [Rhodospirillaceae bacterium]MBT6512950.1 TetR/AcrR family transcriptional regulator [Rhodospirillaceae bacterium]MBT7614142.1 TetR/AcrR family transcriptional regulator [Rhodospirillaceae bacterium]
MVGLRERNKAKRRQGILHAAQTLFREHGYGAVAVSDIAAAAGVAEGTVFNYFPAKGDLLLELMVEENARVVARLETRSISRDDDPRDTIADFFLIVAQESFALVDRRTWREVAALLITSAESPFASRYLELRAALKRSLVQLLIGLAKEQAWPMADLGALADLLWRAFWGLFLFIIASDHLSPADLRRTMLRDITLLLPPQRDMP